MAGEVHGIDGAYADTAWAFLDAAKHSQFFFSQSHASEIDLHCERRIYFAQVAIRRHDVTRLEYLAAKFRQLTFNRDAIEQVIVASLRAEDDFWNSV